MYLSFVCQSVFNKTEQPMQQACAEQTTLKTYSIYKSRKDEFSEYMMIKYCGIFQIYGDSICETGFFWWISDPQIDFLT